MRDMAVKYWTEATLILPPTSGSLSQSFEPFLVHARKLQQKRGEMNLISSHLMEDFLILKGTNVCLIAMSEIVWA